MIQNCGWFKRLVKKVLKCAVQIAVVATVVAVTAAVVEPRLHSRHELDKFGNMKNGVYFDHYHTHLNAVAYDALGFEINSGHAFFGEATFNT